MVDMFYILYGGWYVGSWFVLWELVVKMGLELVRWFRVIELGWWDLESFVWDDNSYGLKLELWCMYWIVGRVWIYVGLEFLLVIC